MFVGVFNPEQAKAFINLAHRVMLADKRMAQDEINLINFLEEIMPFDPQIIDTSIPIDNLLKPFDNSQSKMFCLLNLYIVALIDEEYEQREKELIDTIAEKLGVRNDIREETLNIASDLVNSFKELGTLLSKYETQ